MARKQPNKILVQFAKNLAFIREKAGLSQSDLARKAGFTHNFINDLENTKKGFSLDTLEKLSTTLNVEPYMFFLTPEQLSTPRKMELIGVIDLLNRNVKQVFDSTIKDFIGK